MGKKRIWTEEEIEEHYQHVNHLFIKSCKLLGVKKITWRPMQGRVAPVNTAKDYNLGYTDLKKREITLDIFTPRRRTPKSSNGLLRVIAHEIAHIQKPPYRQRFKGRIITRMHFPKFYTQVNKNVDKFKKDKEFKLFFRL
jgi:hypothetical protein